MSQPENDNQKLSPISRRAFFKKSVGALGLGSVAAALSSGSGCVPVGYSDWGYPNLGYLDYSDSWIGAGYNDYDDSWYMDYVNEGYADYADYWDSAYTDY